MCPGWGGGEWWDPLRWPLLPSRRALWTAGRRYPPVPVSTSGFFHFLGERGKFFLRGRSGLETSTPRPGHPTSSTTLCATCRTERFRWRKVNLSRVAGAAGSGESVREPQPLGQGGADSRALPFPKPPGPSLGRHITPRAIDKERWAGWLVPFERGFSFSFPPSAPPPPPRSSFKS